MLKNQIQKQWARVPALLYAIFALLVLYFAGIMLFKVLPYLSFGYAYNFLGTKSDEVLQKPHFMYAFYVHITSSVVVLFSGVPQFSLYFLKKYPKIHRLLGKMYVLAILLLAAPSGLIIAGYANGGLSGKVGFVLQCFTWWILTFWAWEAIEKKQYEQHINMMLRSFALTLAAMSLRTESYLMYAFFQTKPIETYQTVTWLSWVGNLLLVELLIYYGLGKRLLRSIF